MVKAIADAWWLVLARLGLSRHRWQTLPRLTRRAVKAVVWVALGLVLIALFGVWKLPALPAAPDHGSGPANSFGPRCSSSAASSGQLSRYP